ncbi:MAG: hypothetical protein ABSD74_06915 [Rhizomicrobium sp.]
MSTSDVVAGLMQKLKDTGLADLPGKLLYSGVATVSPGNLYVLGWNPGGDPDAENNSTADHLTELADKSPDWNEYTDGVWRPRGRICDPGEAPMQKRVRHLLTGIGLPIRSVCASNVVFVRSRISSDLDNPADLARRCWPVHEFILKHVHPNVILSIGGEPVLNFIRNRGRLVSDQEEFPSGHGTWRCLSVHVQLGNQRMAIISVPHLARYAIDHHPDVVRWVCSKLEL